MKICKSNIPKNIETLVLSTSSNKPLHIDILNLEKSNYGFISMSSAPGKKSKKEYRNLKDDLKTLKNNKIDVLVSLLELWELDRSTTISNENENENSNNNNNSHRNRNETHFFNQEMVEQYNMEWIHFSIRDKWIPCNTNDYLYNLIKPIIIHLQNGKNVHVHCHGGKGRTGTLVAIILLILQSFNHINSSSNIENNNNNQHENHQSLSLVVKRMRACRSGMLKNPLHHWYIKWLLYNNLLSPLTHSVMDEKP